MRDIGIGIIGYAIGKVHAHAWFNLRQFFPGESAPMLAAVCGRNEVAVKSFAKNYGFKKTYREWKDLLNDPNVAILDNCAPPNVHLEPCILAAEAGKAVLCEKPLARTADEAYEMYRAVSKTGQVHMTGFNKRFTPAILYARDLVQTGRLGRINHVVVTCYNIEFGEGLGNPDLPLSWVFRREIGGHGALSDIGSHVVDLARFTVGEIASVCGAVQTFVESRPLSEDPSKRGPVDVDDLTAGCLRFSKGAIGTINVTWMPVGTRDWAMLEVYGTHGSFRFNFERPNELELYLQDEDVRSRGFRTVYCGSRSHTLAERFWPDQGGAYGFEQTFVSEVAHFLSSVENGVSVEPIGATFYDGYMTCLINDELVASAYDGKWHPIQPKSK